MPTSQRLSSFGSMLGLDWIAFKTFLEHSVSISQDALHVLVGVLAQIGLAVVLRSSLRAGLPYLLVLAFELGNEANDLRADRWPDLAMQLGESAKDLMLTMFLPTVLLLLARTRPRLFDRR